MREFINYFEEDKPAVFEIGLNPDNPHLRVAVHPSFGNFLHDITTNQGNNYTQKYIPFYEQELRIAKFQGFVDQTIPWGFGNIMIPRTDNGDWLTWDCKLPKVKKDNPDHWPNLFGVTATLHILTMLAKGYDQQTDSTKPQLVYLDMLVQRQRSAISVDLTKAIIPWIMAQEEQSRHPKIAEAMQKTYKYIGPSAFLADRGRFLAFFRKPFWVNLSVPGDACGLDPRDYYVNTDKSGKVIIEGYTLLPHNVDSPVQQLSLLAGIAAMHDEARKFSVS